jgi:hypothetical protein
MPDKVIQTATTPDRIKFMSTTAKTLIANRIGITGVPELDDKDIKKLSDLMSKTPNKPVEFVINFDGDGFNYFVRFTSTRIHVTSINLANVPNLDVDKVLNNLVSYGAATKDLVVKFKKAHPDQKALGALKQQITDLEKKIKDDQKKLADLKKQYSDLGGK